MRAKPDLHRLAQSFGFATALPFGGSFRCGPMIPSECSVLASKAKPLCLTFDGLVSTRFLSHNPSGDMSGKRLLDKKKNTRSQSPHENDFVSNVSGDVRSVSSWKGVVYKTGKSEGKKHFWGNMFNTMKKRWAVVQNGEILWYKKQDEKTFRGKLSLRNYSVNAVVDSSKKDGANYKYGVILKPADAEGRTMKIFVESLAMRKNLVEALAVEIRMHDELETDMDTNVHSIRHLVMMETAT